MRIVKIPTAVDVGWANFHADKPLRVDDATAAVLVAENGGVYMDEAPPKPKTSKKKKESAVMKVAETPEDLLDKPIPIGGDDNAHG